MINKSKKKQRTKPPPSTPLLCVLVSEIDEPKALSRVDACSGCGKGVWRALSSPPSVRAICRNCMLMEMQMSGAEKVAIVPPTKKQRVDIVNARDLVKRFTR